MDGAEGVGEVFGREGEAAERWHRVFTCRGLHDLGVCRAPSFGVGRSYAVFCFHRKRVDMISLL